MQVAALELSQDYLITGELVLAPTSGTALAFTVMVTHISKVLCKFTKELFCTILNLLYILPLCTDTKHFVTKITDDFFGM